MSFLLDTNVISEWAKPRPDPKVIEWLAEADEDRLYLSVVSFAELARGIELLPKGQRRERLSAWVEEDLVPRFEGRILGIDLRVASAWGTLLARSHALGLTTHTMDGFLAATASAFDLTLVTRNVRDFDRLGIRLLDPWNADGPEG